MSGLEPARRLCRQGRRGRQRRTWQAGAALLTVAALVVAVGFGAGWWSAGNRSAPIPASVGGYRVGAHVGPAVELVANGAPAIDPSGTVVPDTTQLSRGEVDLSANLLRVLTASGNVAASPASLDLALAMLLNGARGSTASQIAHVLGTTGMSDAALDGQWAALTQAWDKAATAAGIDFSSANSVWVDKGFSVARAFMTALAQYYGAGVWQVDFQHQMQAALVALNAWTSQHTHGRITKLFTQLPAATVLVLANAIYFKAAWAVPFNANLTSPAAFRLASGATVQASFMSSGEAQNYACAVTPNYQAVALPYRGGRFAAEVIMPTHGSLSSFVAGLNGTALSDIAASLDPQAAVVDLPKFSLSTTTNLLPVLSRLGMPIAFGDSANFSGMSSTPTQIAAAIQRVYLRVAEKGTEAAAVTGMAAIPSSLSANPALQLNFNHPFLFLIRDVQTGAIMFEAAITNPTA